VATAPWFFWAHFEICVVRSMSGSTASLAFAIVRLGGAFAPIFASFFDAAAGAMRCAVFDVLGAAQPAGELGCVDGQLVADVARYRRWQHLIGESPYPWRSGIKHDCAAVMELRRVGDQLRNGLGEAVEIEDGLLYRMRSYPTWEEALVAAGAAEAES